MAEIEDAGLPRVVAEIPWGHNIVLLEKVKHPAERLWYARETQAQGWSRNVLVHQIESRLYHRQGRAVTNFAVTLPPAHSDLAAELLKDPYHFDFLALGPMVEERVLERALLVHLRDFLLELGVGFALVGSQHRLAVAGQDFFVDLLFYHLSLRCFVAVELKVGAFQPEYAGKMSFYLAAVDDLLRKEGDGPSIGLILCKERDRVLAEYALRGSSKPIGVAGYRLTGDLPGILRGSLPTRRSWRTSSAPPPRGRWRSSAQPAESGADPRFRHACGRIADEWSSRSRPPENSGWRARLRTGSKTRTPVRPGRAASCDRAAQRRGKIRVTFR